MKKQTKPKTIKNSEPGSKRSRAEKPANETIMGHNPISRRLPEIEGNDRKQIEREFFESIGQSLVVLKLSLGRTLQLLINDIQSAFAETGIITDEMNERLRIVSDTLMPSTLDDFGLLKALEDLFQRYTDSTLMKINFHNEGIERRIPPETEATIYRIISETLYNAVNRLQASEVTVDALVKNNTVGLTITVTGDGLDASGSDGGQISAWERVLLLGGSLSIETLPGMLCLSAELPIAGIYDGPGK